MELGQLLAIIAVALSVVLPGLGSAFALSAVGQSAAGVVTEDPDKFGSVLILQAIPGTQGIYGLLIGFITMLKLNVFGVMATVPVDKGWMLIAASMPIAIVGLLSALAQGKVAVAGVNLIGKRAGEAGKAITFAVMVETYAVLALLASFLMINGIQL